MKKNNYYLAAGIICLFTALLHTIGGQLTLVDPMLQSKLDIQVKSELLGAWHLVTVILWFFGFILAKNGWQVNLANSSMIKMMGLLFFLFGFVFILVIIVQRQHTPQYILFFPIAILIYIGYQKQQKVSQ